MSDTPLDLQRITARTLCHYDGNADAFWTGTHDHDVSQNIEAILRHIQKPAPARILDFGCGPGRDLVDLKGRGHDPMGLDGAARFCEMARHRSGCDVLHQDFLQLDLPPEEFDGVFANASLFHVPRQELPRVLSELHATLKPGGVLFSSNPRGEDQEGWNGDRYGSYHSVETWRTVVQSAGFRLIEEYYRPAGRPRAQQPWLATVWRR